MESTSYKIDKLRGYQNWARFEYEMESIFVFDECWEVVMGEELEPTPPTTPIGDSETGSASLKATALKEKYEKELKVWVKKNRKARARLVIYTEDGPREHIKDLKNVFEQWAKLKELYGATDISTRDAAILGMSRMQSSAYKSIQEYSEAIKKHYAVLVSMGAPLPSWLLSTYFRIGLEEGLEPYIFQLIQGAKASGKELQIDEMTTALSEHDKRVKSYENSVAMAARFGKQDKAKPSSRSRSRNSPESEEEARNSCSHCDAGPHSKEKCYYLHLERRPGWWKPARQVEERIQANKKKASSAKTQGEYLNKTKDKSSEERPTRLIRLFGSKLINTAIYSRSKEQAVYIDTASNVYTLWDRSKFEDYKLVDDILLGIDGNALKVHRIESAIYPRILNGKVENVRLTGVHYVPKIYYNLLSVACLEDKGCYISIKDGRFNNIDGEDNEIVLSGT